MPDTIVVKLLTREGAAEFLTGHGYKISARHLSNLSSAGNGPPVNRYYCRRPLYTPNGLLTWAESRCRPGDPEAA
jgi:hypothetical protein